MRDLEGERVKHELFTSSSIEDGAGVHLPSLIVTQKGTAIAVCQLRKKSEKDWGHDTDLIMRRSEDGGKTWEPMQIIYSGAGVNAVNGALVEDRQASKLIQTFSMPSANKVQTQAHWVQHFAAIGGSICTIESFDEGKTWSDLKETKPISEKGYIAWPSNSVHGIQLASGRLVIGGFVHRLDPSKAIDDIFELEYATGLLYSDDHGETWHIGATIPHLGTDEVSIVDTAATGIYLNFRYNNHHPRDHSRGYARSLDGGQTFSEIGQHQNLSWVDCHIGLTRWAREDQDILIYSGPIGPGRDHLMNRERLTLWLSFDAGRTWPVRKLLDHGDAQYSDLAVASDGAILCMYGCETFDQEQSRIFLARFPIELINLVYRHCLMAEKGRLSATDSLG